jgi:hypothetical protein
LALVEDLERFFVEALFERELIFFVICRSDFSRRDNLFPTFVNFLALASAAPPGSALREHRSHDLAAATQARLAESAVDAEGVLESASEPVGIHVVVDAAPAHCDRAFQNVDYGAM